MADLIVTPGQSEAPPLERAAQARRIANQLDLDAIEAVDNGDHELGKRLRGEAYLMRGEALELEHA